MSLRQRRAAEQFPKAGWPVSDNELVVMHGGKVIGTLRRMDGGPQQGQWLGQVVGMTVIAQGVETEEQQLRSSTDVQIA